MRKRALGLRRTGWLYRVTALILSWVFPATTVWASTPMPQRDRGRETHSADAPDRGGPNHGGPDHGGPQHGRPDPLPNLEAKAPHVILASGRRAPTGVATSPDGRVFFRDWMEGAVFEVVAPDDVRVVADGLRHPRGLAWGGDDSLLLVADGLRRQPPPAHHGGLLLSLNVDSGEVEVLASGWRRPRDVSRGEDGSLLVTADGRWPPAPGDDEDEDDEDEWGIWPAWRAPGGVWRVTGEGEVEEVVRGLVWPGSVVALGDGRLLVAAQGYVGGPGSWLSGSVFEVAADGAVSVRSRDWLKVPFGLVQDGLHIHQTGAGIAGDRAPGDQ